MRYLALAALAAGAVGCQPQAVQTATRTLPPAPAFKVVGASFSPQNAEWRTKDWRQSFQALLATGANPIRYSVQMKEHEPQPRTYDFRDAKEALAMCRAAGRTLILCCGAKSPRWPEVHVPDFYRDRLNGATTLDPLEQEVLAFERALLKEFGHDPTVEAIQIENEPLEMVGPLKVTVSLSMLAKEMAQARQLTTKPLILTMGAGMTENPFVAQLKRPGMLKSLLSLKPDWVRFNFYQKGFWKNGGFEAKDGNWVVAKALREQAEAAGVKVGVAEYQAEPWPENPGSENLKEPEGNASLTPSQYIELGQRLKKAGFKDVWIWGWEFQYACDQAGNKAWVEATKSIIAARQ